MKEIELNEANPFDAHIHLPCGVDSIESIKYLVSCGTGESEYF